MKPPVVVIGRHCKTNQCWITVRFKKTQSVAKISQTPAQARADDAPFGKRVPPTASPRNNFFGHECARHSRKFSFSPFLTLAMGQSPSTRPKEHRAERRAPPTVERCLLPRAPGESGTPIILQGLPKRRRGTADDPKGRAERPRTFPRGSSYVCRRFPRRACDSLKLPPCRSGGRCRSTASATA
jgi:hypothetical protein